MNQPVMKLNSENIIRIHKKQYTNTDNVLNNKFGYSILLKNLKDPREKKQLY